MSQFAHDNQNSQTAGLRVVQENRGLQATGLGKSTGSITGAVVGQRRFEAHAQTPAVT